VATNILRSLFVLLAVGGTFLSASCADPREFKTVPKEIKRYYKRFQGFYGIDPSYITAGFTNRIKEERRGCSAVAECRIYSNGYFGWREIVIETIAWDKMDDYGREELIFHELGHCALHLDHVEETRADYCPLSIMYPYVFGDSWCYSDYRDELILDLENRYEERNNNSGETGGHKLLQVPRLI
jgi:hypothetical protein